MGSTIQLRVDRITIDPSLQVRVDGVDPAHVRTLAEAPERWGPLAVARRAGSYLLVDGFHRFACAQELGLEEVEVRVLPVSDDADLRAEAFALNVIHGRPLSLTDRRAEAARLLELHPDVSTI